jgi:hypothetical protein
MNKFKYTISLICMLFMCSVSFARITNYPGASADPETCWGAVGAEACVDKNGSVIPTTDNDADLGTSSLEWKDIYSDGTIYADAISLTGTMTHTGALNVTGDTSLDGALTVNDSGADKNHRFETDNDANALFIDGGLDAIGIGTATPSAKIDAVESLVAATGNEIAYELNYTTNKSSSGNDTGLFIGMTNTASPGTSLPLDIQVDAGTVFSVNEAGNTTVAGTLGVTGTSTLAATDIVGTTTVQGAVTINESGADVDTRIEGDTNANLLVVDAGDDTVSIGGGTGIKEILTATAALDFPSITTVTDEDLTITVTGAAVGDACHLGLPAAPTGNLAWNCFVSATDTVTVRVHNYTDGAIDPASATYRVVTFGY